MGTKSKYNNNALKNNLIVDMQSHSFFFQIVLAMDIIREKSK